MTKQQDTHHYTTEEVLRLHKPLSWLIASEYANGFIGIDDVQQECIIALWQVSKDKPGDSLRGLASVVMRRRAREVAIRRGPVLGEASKRGSPSQDPMKKNIDSVDRLKEEFGDEFFSTEDFPRQSNALKRLPDQDMQDYTQAALDRGAKTSNIVKMFRNRYPQWANIQLG